MNRHYTWNLVMYKVVYCRIIYESRGKKNKKKKPGYAVIEE